MASLLRARPALTLLEFTRCPVGGCERLKAQCLSTSVRPESEGTVVARRERFRLSVDSINPFLKNMEYAVRGPILSRALEIEQALKEVASGR